MVQTLNVASLVRNQGEIELRDTEREKAQREEGEMTINLTFLREFE